MEAPRSMLRREFADVEVGSIRQFVKRFYDVARKDPLLAPTFAAALTDEQWPDHIDRITAFWSNVLLSTGDYRGNPILRHMGLDLEDRHFERWLELFGATAEEVLPDVAEPLVHLASRMADGMQRTLRLVS